MLTPSSARHSREWEDFASPDVCKEILESDAFRTCRDQDRDTIGSKK